MILPFTGCAPTRGTPSSAGLDLGVTSIDKNIVHTGTYVAIPEGNFGMVLPRSSLGAKGLFLMNTVGIIDSDYRGEILLNIAGYLPEVGERIAQLVIVPYVHVDPIEVTALDATERGAGGFGSTGKD